MRPWTSAEDQLRRLADTAIILAAITCSAAWVWYLVVPRSVRIVEPEPDYEIGDTLSEVPELVALRGQRIFLVVMSSGCQFCTDSMPFYRRVVAAREGAHARTLIVAAFREDKTRAAAYLDAHGFVPDRMIWIPRDSPFRIVRTPAIVLVGEDQRVAGLWYGRLRQSDESLVQAAALDPSVPASHRPSSTR